MSRRKRGLRRGSQDFARLLIAEKVDAVEDVSTNNVAAILEETSTASSVDPIAANSTDEPNPNARIAAPVIDPTAEEAAFKIEAQTTIDTFEVHGFRSAGTNPRLLVSGRVFRLNDTVNHQLGIKFIGSRDGAFVFKDSLCFEYTKSL